MICHCFASTCECMVVANRAFSCIASMRSSRITSAIIDTSQHRLSLQSLNSRVCNRMSIARILRQRCIMHETVHMYGPLERVSGRGVSHWVCVCVGGGSYQGIRRMLFSTNLLVLEAQLTCPKSAVRAGVCRYISEGEIVSLSAALKPAMVAAENIMKSVWAIANKMKSHIVKSDFIIIMSIWGRVASIRSGLVRLWFFPLRLFGALQEQKHQRFG